MKIDGQRATSGTIVIGSGRTGEIDLPWGLFTLVFNPLASPQKVSLTTNSGKNEITFDGANTPLGMAIELAIPLTTGGPAILALAVYAIGDVGVATHVVHYTVSGN